ITSCQRSVRLPASSRAIGSSPSRATASHSSCSRPRSKHGDQPRRPATGKPPASASTVSTSDEWLPALRNRGPGRLQCGPAPGSSPLPPPQVLRLTLQAPNRAPTSSEPLPAANRARLLTRPLASGHVVRRHGFGVLRTPPPHVL